MVAMDDRDLSDALAGQVSEAAEQQRALRIRAGGSKDFYGREPRGDLIDVSGHRGIVNYEPTELVCTVRAGTPLTAVEAALAEQRQVMPFEPPHFSDSATIGGATACGLSGPRRPWGGAARDLVLGVRLINGRGQAMRFGGEVMKNVAGYDISRLVVGSLGTLGVLTEISMKVMPAPDEIETRVLEVAEEAGFRAVEEAYREGLPVTGAAHDGERLYVRLAGTPSAVRSGRERLGGEGAADPETFWRDLRDHALEFFGGDDLPLWRLSLPPLTPLPELPGRRLADWGGQLHWVRTDAPAFDVFRRTASAGGHATLFRGGGRDGEIFQPLPAGSWKLHQRIKAAFDPAGILNPGRLYADL